MNIHKTSSSNQFSGYTGCLNKECIAYQLSLDKSIQKQIRVMFNYANYTEDLVQDIILQILTIKDDTKIVELSQQNNINWYIFAILKAQKKNTSSKTNKMYTGVFEFNLEQNDTLFEANSYLIEENKQHVKHIISLLMSELKNIEHKNWYDAKVFSHYVLMRKEYEEEGKKLTFEEFGKKMNINYKSLFRVVKKVKEQLKNKIKDEL